LGVNFTFFPMHFLGLAGLPRRIPDYPDIYVFWNQVATFGTVLTMLSLVYYILSLTYGRFFEHKYSIFESDFKLTFKEEKEVA
jgi:heme/copper-type cytochrome/quinol oxidase subunit 1